MESLAKMLIGVEDVVVEGVEFDEGLGAVVIDARPYRMLPSTEAYNRTHSS